MDGTQFDLFLSAPLLKEQDTVRSLLNIVEWYNTGKLLKPEFQRGYSWDIHQEKGWSDSIVSNQAIGVIVTYQLPSGGPSFLADGLQRVIATARFLQNPERYGYSFGVAQAKLHVETFGITVQHRIYATHDDALKAFQRLNRGTALEPFDFWRGTMVLDERGKYLHEELPITIKKYESRFATGKRVSDKERKRADRDAFALFYRYASKHKEQEVKGVSNLNLHSGDTVAVEATLMNYIVNQSLTIETLHKQVADFDAYLAQNVSGVNTILSDIGLQGKTIARTLLHWLWHVNIWARNNDRPMKLYWDLVRKLFYYLKDSQYFSSRFEEPKSNPIRMLTLRLGDTGSLSTLCEAFDIPLLTVSRTSRPSAILGYHNSHVKPYSKNGEGPTVIEASAFNLIRGAKDFDVADELSNS